MWLQMLVCSVYWNVRRLYSPSANSSPMQLPSCLSSCLQVSLGRMSANTKPHNISLGSAMNVLTHLQRWEVYQRIYQPSNKSNPCSALVMPASATLVSIGIQFGTRFFSSSYVLGGTCIYCALFTINPLSLTSQPHDTAHRENAAARSRSCTVATGGAPYFTPQKQIVSLHEEKLYLSAALQAANGFN